MDDQSNTWMQCTTVSSSSLQISARLLLTHWCKTLDKFVRCVSQEQVSLSSGIPILKWKLISFRNRKVGVFLHKYGHLVRDQMLDTTELEFPTDVDLDADLGSWVDLLHLPDTVDWYDNDWLLVDTAEL